ncbi:cysteine--tRNA ligase [Candidatus Parcubacteria bacterium]|nr:cysteine--tRNA ligase [Candidatus Parcubacteria bacterium]
MVLSLYSTLTREKETLAKKKGETVGLYTCGPTVYHYAHIGNLRSFVFSDTLARTLRYGGWKVRQVMNITDVGHLTDDTGEDKVEREAKREHKSAADIAAIYTDAFMEDLHALNVNTNDISFPKASEHIAEQIVLIKALEAKGFTYVAQDGVYFDTEKDADYGKLSHLDKEALKAGARVEPSAGKKYPADFALWKFSAKGGGRLQEWESPWGTGFPGWHIECSAMAMKYLGEHFDIHTGGQDLSFPHHENEIAQSESATGKKFVDVWLHSGFLNMAGGKMAKSEGNDITLVELAEKGFTPLAYRYYLLSTHYRKPIEWSEQAMTGAQNSLERLYDRYLALGDATGSVDASIKAGFETVLGDDLNTPLALAMLSQVFESKLGNADKKATILDFDRVLGLGLGAVRKVEVPESVLSISNQREAARKAGDFAQADALRRDIEERGFTVRDTPQGPKLSPKRA